MQMLGNIIRRLDKVEGLLYEGRAAKWYDPALFITKWENLTAVWHYKGIYYKVKSRLLAAMGDKAWNIKTFESIIKDPDRIDELWERGVQPEYITRVGLGNYYICSNGELLHLNLSECSHSRTISGILLVVDREEYTLDRAKSVMQHFRGERLEVGVSMFFLDGDFGNCRIDNLNVPGAIEPHTTIKSTETIESTEFTEEND